MHQHPNRGRHAVVIAILAAVLMVPAMVAGPAAASAGPEQATYRTGGAVAPAADPQTNTLARPRARAACPVCPVIAVTAIRTIAVRAAPVAIKAATRIGGSATRKRVAASARKVKTFTKRAATTSGVRAVTLFERLPKYARGCGRGFVDHIRDPADLRLSAVFLACARGIVDIYLGKSPYRPIDR